MSSYSRDVFASQPLSPALRNDVVNSYGVISPLPVLGTDWTLRVRARIDPGQKGYLLCVNGDRPAGTDESSNLGLIVGFSGPDVIEYFCYEYFPGYTNLLSRVAFPTGHQNRENDYEIISSSASGVTLYLNGELVGSHPKAHNVDFVGKGLFVGSYRGYVLGGYGHLYVHGRYDNLQVKIGQNLIADVNFNDGTGSDASGNGHAVQLGSGAIIYPDPASGGGTYSDTYTDLY